VKEAEPVKSEAPAVVAPAVVEAATPPSPKPVSAPASPKPAPAPVSPAKPTGPPALKKGMILKEGHVIRNWKNRFFVLEKGKLAYFENQKADYPYGVTQKGEVSLKGVSVSVNKNIVSLNTKNEQGKEVLALNLDIKYPNEREEWVAAIQEHIAYINGN
jgi:hypothetical protein